MEKICPYSRLKESECNKCMAYQEDETHWRETHLVERDVKDEDTGEEFKEKEEDYTGRTIHGILISCKLAMLSRKAIPKTVTDEKGVTTPWVEAKK